MSNGYLQIWYKKISILLRDIISFIIYISFFYCQKRGDVTLVYHSVGYAELKNDPFRLNILPLNFERHLKVISKCNHNVNITFDDGYCNIFQNAFGLLKKYNLSAAVFLVTDFIDGRLNSENFAGKNFKASPLTWDEIRAMDKAGIAFGSHSKTHAVLSKISPEQMRSELIDSKKRIEEMLGHRIDSFAYPFGGLDSFNDMTKEALQNGGYRRAFTNIMGYNSLSSDKFTLRRIRICSEDGLFRFKMKIKGAYIWMDIIRNLCYRI